MELENLEQHLLLEHRLRQTEDHRKQYVRYQTSETQTEVTNSALVKLEKSLEIKQNELEIQAYKEKQDLT